IKNYRDVASANWAVVPQYIGRFENDFLLCDIGSTTTDLTPVRGGKISNLGLTDFERMRHGELLYTGYLRTPLQSVLQNAKIRGRSAPLSAEFFSQIGDAHLLLRNISKKNYNSPTPDNGPKTSAGALRRLARSLLADEGELSKAELLSFAKQAVEAQREKTVLSAHKFGLPIIPIGTGSFILDSAIKKGKLRLHDSAWKYKSLDPSLALALLLRR
ncbi:MAG: hypothetical protein HY280_03430, partial [Nitrospinae bacterium]|nr:hypothetical protein [Nitrospinota bacterium]